MGTEKSDERKRGTQTKNGKEERKRGTPKKKAKKTITSILQSHRTGGEKDICWPSSAIGTVDSTALCSAMGRAEVSSSAGRRRL